MVHSVILFNIRTLRYFNSMDRFKVGKSYSDDVKSSWISLVTTCMPGGTGPSGIVLVRMYCAAPTQHWQRISRRSSVPTSSPFVVVCPLSGGGWLPNSAPAARQSVWINAKLDKIKTTQYDMSVTIQDDCLLTLLTSSHNNGHWMETFQ